MFTKQLYWMSGSSLAACSQNLILHLVMEPDPNYISQYGAIIAL